MRLLHNRKGILAFSDLFWILVFCLVAFIMFMFLFKPLVEKNVKGKEPISLSSLKIPPMYGDTEYIALGLREREPEAGSGGAPAATFGRTIQKLVEQRRALGNDDDAFEKEVKASGYGETLDAVFGKDKGFWTGASYVTTSGKDVKERTWVYVIVKDGDEWLKATCREYDSEGPQMGVLDKRYCNHFLNNKLNTDTVVDPDTQKEMPAHDEPVEPGSIYIPTAVGPATLYVFVIREEN